MIQLRHFIISSALLWPGSLPANTHNFIVSPSLYIFDYAEYDFAGNFLDGETGVLPGLQLAYQFNHDRFSVLAQYSQYAANIDYDGHTQSGIPHQTLTDTLLRFYNLSLYTAELNQTGRVFIRFGSGYWDRNILPSGNVAGLHEIYRWNEIAAGFRIDQHTTQLDLWAELSLLKTQAAEMDVLLPAEDVTLILGNHYGFRLEAGRYFPASNNLEIGLSGFIEYWQFGRSEPVYVADFFGDPAYIHEPDSESRHWGLRFNVVYHY
ncbi:MAG: hypothetical protein OQL09_05850 [Gammaproteobacteria bacterium]|nr:hypothetical protein [Gammaproteobacteria bacterium]